jgi:hypothetical protein
MFRNTIKLLFAFVFAFVLSFLISSTTLAQPSAKFAGQVTDSFGDAIPNATVTIKNTANSLSTVVITDGSGSTLSNF